MLAECIHRFGVEGQFERRALIAPLPGGYGPRRELQPDRRVAFVMLHDEKRLSVRDFVAVPPSGVLWLENAYGAMARDFHVGWLDFELHTPEAIKEQRVLIGQHIDRMTKGPRGFAMSSNLIPRFLHARKLAYQANPAGRLWGTQSDFPPEEDE
jgi:hypothetical protein